jgi:hypothetical protein
MPTVKRKPFHESVVDELALLVENREEQRSQFEDTCRFQLLLRLIIGTEIPRGHALIKDMVRRVGERLGMHMCSLQQAALCSIDEQEAEVSGLLAKRGEKQAAAE